MRKRLMVYATKVPFILGVILITTLIVFFTAPKNPAILLSFNFLTGLFIYILIGSLRQRLKIVIALAAFTILSLKSFDIFDPATVMLCLAAFTGLAILVK